MAKKKADESGTSFEKELDRLEKIVEKLEGEMPGLDQSIKLYEEGVRSLKACQKRLAEAESRIKTLMEGTEEPELTDFDAAAAERNNEEDEAPSTAPPRRKRKPRGRGLF